MCGVRSQRCAQSIAVEGAVLVPAFVLVGAAGVVAASILRAVASMTPMLSCAPMVSRSNFWFSADSVHPGPKRWAFARCAGAVVLWGRRSRYAGRAAA